MTINPIPARAERLGTRAARGLRNAALAIVGAAVLLSAYAVVLAVAGAAGVLLSALTSAW